MADGEGPHLEYFEIAILLDDENGENTKEVIPPKKILARSKDAAMLRVVRMVPQELEKELELGYVRIIVEPLVKTTDNCACQSQTTSCYCDEEKVEQDPLIGDSENDKFVCLMYKDKLYWIKVIKVPNMGVGYEPYYIDKTTLVSTVDIKLAESIALHCFYNKLGF